MFFFPLGPYSYTLLAPIFCSFLTPVASRQRGMTGNGARRPAVLGPRRVRLFGACCSLAVIRIRLQFVFFVGVGAGVGSASSNSASPSPVPLAQPPPTCWLASYTFCILCAFFKLRGAPMLQEPSVTACGVSSPCDKIEKSLLPISCPAADVCSPATAQ